MNGSRYRAVGTTTLRLLFAFLAILLSVAIGPSIMVSADTTAQKIEGSFFSPVFGSSNDHFYASTPIEEEVDGAAVYLSDFLKIRTSDLQVLSTARLNFNAYRILVSVASTFAYAYGDTPRIARIDLSNLSVTYINIASLDNVSRLEIDSAGTYGYLTGNKFDRYVSEREVFKNYVLKINLSSGTVIGTVGGSEGSGLEFYGIALHEAENFGCVVDNEQGILQGISLSPFAWNHQRCSSQIGVNPVDIEFDSSKTFGYVTVSAEKKLLKFKIDTQESVKSLSFPSYTSKFRLNPAMTYAYVVDEERVPSKLYKISLSTFEVVEEIAFPTSNADIGISPDGSIGIVVAGGLTKLLLSVTAPQAITFVAPASKLTGAGTVTVTATSSSLLPVSFATTSPAVCSVTGSVVRFLHEGDCTIIASQSGSTLWDPATSVSRTFKVFQSPPSASPGISILAGNPYTNTKNVTLSVSWPEYADSVILSNDGGFASAGAVVKKLSSSTSWTLDDSVRGMFTKVVYARFTGEGIDATKTFSDDIVLDTESPVLGPSSAKKSSGSVVVDLKATDDVTGLSKVEVRKGTNSVVRDYSARVTLTEKEIGVSALAVGTTKQPPSAIDVRVSDKAGNWSEYKTLMLQETVEAPRVTTSKSVSAKSVAAYAGLSVLSTSKVSLKVVSSSAKYCKVSGLNLKGLKAGLCKVTVTVTPKRGNVTSRTVAIKVAT